jgi:hypothetical protein
MHKNALTKIRTFLGQDLTITGDFNLNMIQKNEFKKNKIAGNCIKDIKGIYIYFIIYSNSPFTCFCMPVIPLSPELLLVDYPI